MDHSVTYWWQRWDTVYGWLDSPSGCLVEKTQSDDRGDTSTASQSQTDMAETGELTEMLKALLEDRKTLEADLREERRVLAEETAEIDEGIREQMDLLRGLVERAHGEGGDERRVTIRAHGCKRH